MSVSRTDAGSLDEHVARAITAIAYPQSPWDDKDCCTPSMKKHALRQARAAIDTMRGPAWYEYLDSIRESERAACEAIAREGSFPFDIDVWLNATKKEMTAHVALAIADAIAARKGKGEVK